jgi:glycosyltransferase involved in cell wall biosynthesis
MIRTLETGGAEMQVVNLLRAMDRETFDISVWSTHGGGPLKEVLRSEGIDVVSHDFGFYLSPIAIRKLANKLRDERVQIVHTHLFQSGILGRLAARLAGVPLVVHTLHAPSSWKRRHGFKTRAKIWLDSYVCNHLTDVNTATSQWVKKYQTDIGKVDPNQIDVLNNCVNIGGFDPEKFPSSLVLNGRTIRRSDNVVINVARLHPIKGQDVLVEAADRVIQSVPDALFLIVGKGESLPSLQEQINLTNLKERVLLTGERRDVPALLLVSKVFVLSSLSEGVPISLLESMAAGLPSVTTRVGGLPNVVHEGRTGLLVPPGDPDRLARSIVDLLTDEERRAHMGKQAREQAIREYSAESAADAMKHLYLRHLKE